jgi:hypothetical protein
MLPKSTLPENDDVEAVVTLADDDIHRIGSVAKALTKKGFTVSHLMESSGIIAGSAKRQSLEGLRKTKGVAALEIAGEVSIAPPDADVQ